MVVCKECNREFETLDSLRRHRIQKHNINAEQTYIDYMLNGVNQTCKCGCSEKPKFLGIDAGYRDYKLGHAARIKNNWGHNTEAIKKSHETQKKMFNDGSLRIWNKGLTVEDKRVKDNVNKALSNPERGKNISKGLKGKSKSKEHKDNLSKTAKIRWLDINERDKQSVRLIKRLIKNNYRNGKSELESTFEKILTDLGLVENEDYIYQYQVSSAIFDFYLHNKNVLIEVDGNFHHCNPDSIHKIPKYPIQLKTVGNDIRKNRIAEEKGFKLLRFWESDINNNPEEVIKTLKNELL